MVFMDWAEWESVVDCLASEAVAVGEGDRALRRLEALECRVLEGVDPDIMVGWSFKGVLEYTEGGRDMYLL